MIADYTPPPANIRPLRREAGESSFPSFDDDVLQQRGGRFIRRGPRGDSYGCGNGMLIVTWTRSLADAVNHESPTVGVEFDSVPRIDPVISLGDLSEVPVDDSESGEFDGRIFAAPVPMNVIATKVVRFRISDLATTPPFLKLDPDDLDPIHEDEFEF